MEVVRADVQGAHFLNNGKETPASCFDSRPPCFAFIEQVAASWPSGHDHLFVIGPFDRMQAMVAGARMVREAQLW